MMEIKGIRAAANYANVSHNAIHRWVKKHGIGEMRKGVFFIRTEELDPIINARKALNFRQK